MPVSRATQELLPRTQRTRRFGMYESNSDNELMRKVIGLAIEVHKELGP